MRPAALQRRRARLEAAIESAIAALDALDGDADLEDDAGGENDGLDEPDFVLVERFSIAATSENAAIVPLCAPLVCDQTRQSAEVESAVP